jgi:hypothetical protein
MTDRKVVQTNVHMYIKPIEHNAQTKYFLQNSDKKKQIHFFGVVSLQQIATCIVVLSFTCFVFNTTRVTRCAFEKLAQNVAKTICCPL